MAPRRQRELIWRVTALGQQVLAALVQLHYHGLATAIGPQKMRARRAHDADWDSTGRKWRPHGPRPERDRPHANATFRRTEAAGAAIVEERTPSPKEIFLAHTKGVEAGSSQSRYSVLWVTRCRGSTGGAACIGSSRLRWHRRFFSDAAQTHGSTSQCMST